MRTDIYIYTHIYHKKIVYYKHAGFVFLGWFLMKRRQVRRGNDEIG